MQDLETKLGYKFTNLTLLKLALTHKSIGKNNNEKMEFLGDSILNFITADYLFQNFRGISEGDMSRIRAALVREETLVKIAKRLKLQDRLHISQFQTSKNSYDSCLADAVEAIYAAIYLDGGYATVKPIIESHIAEVLEKREVSLTKDPKTVLQELVQARGFPLPLYSLITSVKVPEHKYTVKCEVPLFKIAVTGEGSTKKQAEIAAAHRAIGLIPK